jgi:hypothetical protein
MINMTKKLLLGTVLSAVLLPVLAGTALADDRGHDQDWREHEVRAHRYWHPPHPVVVEAAPVVYAPPVVVEPPPPFGINLILPLHFN